MSARDLCMIEHLSELSQAGIVSFKIEGRAKTAYYTAVVTNAYRAALDAAERGETAPAWAVRELETISHREYSTGFYYGREPDGQTYRPGSYVQEWELSAVVLGAENGRLIVSERNRFCEGDALELLLPGQPPKKVTVQGLKNEAGEPISAINHPMETVRFDYRGEAVDGAMLRRKRKDA